MEENHTDTKRWIILYPIYINSKKTIAEGRRISSAKACEAPTCDEIVDCCKYLKLQSFKEDKAYPRDFMERGRVRVELKKEDGSPVNPAISSRKMLMLRVAELVPRHPGRTKKQEPSSSASAAAKSSSSGPSKSSTSGPSKPGKGGKKKK